MGESQIQNGSMLGHPLCHQLSYPPWPFQKSLRMWATPIKMTAAVGYIRDIKHECLLLDWSGHTFWSVGSRCQNLSPPCTFRDTAVQILKGIGKVLNIFNVYFKCLKYTNFCTSKSSRIGVVSKMKSKNCKVCEELK